MSDVLIVAVPSTASLGRSDAAAAGFGLDLAGKLSGHCDLLLLGPNAAAVAPAAAKLGVRKILTADHADLAQPTGEARAAAIAVVAEPYRVIAAATSTVSRDSLPRVAARLRAPMVTDVLEIRSADDQALTFTKPSFSGNLLCDQQLRGPKVIATCRPSAFDPPAESSAAAPIESVSLPATLAHPRKKFLELNKTPMSRPELSEADIVVSGGRGTRGPEGFKVLEQLADLLGAAIGASRAAVDSGWMPNDFQVGQTGKVIAPKLYIGCGISGAIQHLAGMRNSKTIVAINKDASAPLFEVADYGLVADLFEAVPQMVTAIQAAKKSS